MNKALLYISLIILTVLIIFALMPQWVTSFSAFDQNANAVLLSPSLDHIAGTDSLGRDLFARLLSATRVSLIISFLSSIIALTIGVIWGMTAGLSGKWLDGVLMRIVDVLYSIPDLLVFILLGLFFGRDMWGLVLALCSLSWLSIARISRAECIKYKEQDFVVGAQAMGLRPFTIAFKHILPQMREALIISVIFKIPFLIALESTLSFIGLGLQPPHASFGTLAKEGFDGYLFYPHLIVFPFLFIFLTVFGFYSIGNYMKSRYE